MVDKTKITISKIDAAQRQLQTAIVLWFTGGDPVSIHTLAYAAYEIIHAISKRLNPNRRDLLFDSDLVKDERRSDWNQLLKKHANFFKHANRLEDVTIDFHPAASELFIMFSILGLGSCRILHTDEEAAYLAWIQIHEPKFLSDYGRKMIAETVSVESIELLRSLSKQEHLEFVRQSRRELRNDARQQAQPG